MSSILRSLTNGIKNFIFPQTASERKRKQNDEESNDVLLLTPYKKARIDQNQGQQYSSMEESFVRSGHPPPKLVPDRPATVLYYPPSRYLNQNERKAAQLPPAAGKSFCNLPTKVSTIVANPAYKGNTRTGAQPKPTISDAFKMPRSVTLPQHNGHAIPGRAAAINKRVVAPPTATAAKMTKNLPPMPPLTRDNKATSITARSMSESRAPITTQPARYLGIRSTGKASSGTSSSGNSVVFVPNNQRDSNVHHSFRFEERMRYQALLRQTLSFDINASNRNGGNLIQTAFQKQRLDTVDLHPMGNRFSGYRSTVITPVPRRPSDGTISVSSSSTSNGPLDKCRRYSHDKPLSPPLIDLAKSSSSSSEVSDGPSLHYVGSFSPTATGDGITLQRIPSVSSVNSSGDEKGFGSHSSNNYLSLLKPAHPTSQLMTKEAENLLAKLKLTKELNKLKADKMREEIERSIMEVNVYTKRRQDSAKDSERYLMDRLSRADELTPYLEDLKVTVDEEDTSAVDFKPLTNEMESRVKAALKPGPGSEVLSDKFNLKITRADLQTLNGLNWLNDEVINFYLEMLMERGRLDNYPKVHAFNTFFYPKIVSQGHAAVKRWTRKVDIFEHDIILIPVHLGMHWCMATVHVKEMEIRYFDSMGGNNNNGLEAIRRYLVEEAKAKGKTIDVSKFKTENIKKIPQQMNGSDCGMFSCKFAEYISRKAKFNFTQEHMPYFRRRMVYEIISKKLL